MSDVAEVNVKIEYPTDAIGNFVPFCKRCDSSLGRRFASKRQAMAFAKQHRTNHQPRSMPLDQLLTEWAVGSHDGWTWQQESDDIWSREQAAMDQLVTDIQEKGMREPVLLGGADGRVWDGHHRIVAAMTLALPTVPYEEV